jgi:predicted short-subunit dehydrogenase-like oxidoreductase (DUF2520 family)
VQDVLDGTPEGSREAVAFIGAGEPAAALESMRAAELWMITTPDTNIVACAERLAAARAVRSGDVVFHCSGSLPSSALASVVALGATIASVHPLKSFADSRAAARTFDGTHCAAEGDNAALDVLVPAFAAVGGRVSRIDPQHKTIYHAASVVASNYLAALMEVALRCYEKAGLDRDTAAQMMGPLARETLENVLSMGTARALTGPVARGDDEVVRRHLEALATWDEGIVSIYRELGTVALDLARQRGEADSAALQRIETLLEALRSR